MTQLTWDKQHYTHKTAGTSVVQFVRGASDRLRSQSIRKYDVPVSEPTKLELALWRMIVSRVKAFKDGLMAVEMASEDERIITDAEPQIYRDAAERLVEGIAKANYGEPNLAIYEKEDVNQQRQTRAYLEKLCSIQREEDDRGLKDYCR